FARRLVNTTDRIFTIASKPGPIAAFVRTKIVPRVIPIVFRFAFMRRFLFRTVSQIAIRYRHSALSAGTAGRIHGGDRWPFSSTMRWQVHVHGEPRPDVAEACAAFGIELHRFEFTAEA